MSNHKNKKRLDYKTGCILPKLDKDKVKRMIRKVGTFVSGNLNILLPVLQKQMRSTVC